MGFDPNIRGGGRGVGTQRNWSQTNVTNDKTRTQTKQGVTHSVTQSTTTDKKAGTTQKGGQQTVDKKPNNGAAVTLAERKAELVKAGDTEGKERFNRDFNGTNVTMKTQGPSALLEGGAKVQVSPDGLTADVSLKVDANLFKAGGEATRTFTIKKGNDTINVTVKLGADAKVGADGELKLKLNLSPKDPKLELSAEGFVGVKGTLSGNIEVSVNNKKVLGAKAEGTLGAGVGGAASFEAGLTGFKAKAFAMAGVGVGVELEGRVYPTNLARSLVELAN